MNHNIFETIDTEINSKKLIKDLNKLGIRPKKTFEVNLPYLNRKHKEAIKALTYFR